MHIWYAYLSLYCCHANVKKLLTFFVVLKSSDFTFTIHLWFTQYCWRFEKWEFCAYFYLLYKCGLLDRVAVVTPGVKKYEAQILSCILVFPFRDNPRGTICHFMKPFFFLQVVNLQYSDVQDRVMLTGRHMVRDVSCKNCNSKLGWIYEFATEDSQRYKEGRVILERALVRESEGFEEHVPSDASWISLVF